MLRPFELRRPATLPELGAILGEHRDAAALYAGGSELLVLMKEGLVRPRVLIDVKRVAGLGEIAAADGTLRIGAAVTHRTVERSPVVHAHCPLVAEAARFVANVRVRSVGTVGGNLAFADPNSDLATLYLLFDARVALWSGAGGERELPLADFVRGPYETARRDDEVLTEVRLHPLPPGAAGAYLKFGVHERPTLGVAAALSLDPARRRVAAARLAVGCIGARPQRLAGLERGLVGAPVEALAAARVDAGAEGLDAITDLHGSADYKLEMAQVFVRRALRLAAARGMRQDIDARYAHTVAV